MQGGPGVVFPGCQAAVWPEVPAGLDAISLDIYYQFPGRDVSGHVGGGWTEVDWAKQFYGKYFLPLLKPHQSVWLCLGCSARMSQMAVDLALARTPPSSTQPWRRLMMSSC